MGITKIHVTWKFTDEKKVNQFMKKLTERKVKYSLYLNFEKETLTVNVEYPRRKHSGVMQDLMDCL